MSFLKKQLSGYEWHEVTQRIETLEDKVFGKKKPPISIGQQILILSHMGMLDAIHHLDMPMGKKYEFLALLLKSDVTNTKKALLAFAKNHADIINPFNYWKIHAN